MAILVGFRKTREDTEQVEYQFGYPEMSRRLVIQKTTQQGQPLDGDPDMAYTAVLTKIVRMQRAETIWPDHGSFAA